MRILLSACLAASTLHAQAGTLQGPSSGFVFEQATQTLRRIQGIPGAALIGPGVEFGFPVQAAAVSPRLDSAIVLSADGMPHLFRLDGDSPVETAVAGLAAAERIAFSPSGTAAALYTNGSVQVIRGLPDSVTVAGTVTLHGQDTQHKAAPANLAVSDDGAYLLYVRA